MTRAGVHVRAGRREDIAAMARVHHAGWLAGFDGIVPDELTPSEAYLVRRLEARWDEPGRSSAVAVVDGEIRGWSGYGPSRDEDAGSHVAEIYTVFVDPLAARGGLGTAIVARALGDLAERGFDEVTVWSFDANAGANAFYDWLGFARDGEQQTHPELGAALIVRYRRPLAPAG